MFTSIIKLVNRLTTPQPAILVSDLLPGPTPRALSEREEIQMQAKKRARLIYKAKLKALADISGITQDQVLDTAVKCYVDDIEAQLSGQAAQVYHTKVTRYVLSAKPRATWPNAK